MACLLIIIEFEGANYFLMSHAFKQQTCVNACMCHWETNDRRQFLQRILPCSLTPDNLILDQLRWSYARCDLLQSTIATTGCPGYKHNSQTNAEFIKGKMWKVHPGLNLVEVLNLKNSSGLPGFIWISKEMTLKREWDHKHSLREANRHRNLHSHTDT